MAAVRQEFAEHVLREYSKRGMLAQLAENAAEISLACLAKPDIGHKRSSPLRSFVRVEVTPSYWHRCWWVRWFRWLYRKRLEFLGKYSWPYKKRFAWVRKWTKFPHWLVELIFGNQIKLVREREPWPDDLLERIQVMRHYLLGLGVEPTKVVVGQKALSDIQDKAMFGFATWHPPINLLMGNKWTVFGLVIEVNPFLAEDEILVV